MSRTRVKNEVVQAEVDLYLEAHGYDGMGKTLVLNRVMELLSSHRDLKVRRLYEDRPSGEAIRIEGWYDIREGGIEK